jgi:hypothetical protein
MATPNQRSKELMESEGFTVALVERYCTWSQRRFDLFGFADLIAVRAGETVAVQSTTLTNLAARRKKIAESEAAPVCLAAGWKIVVHGWAKRGGRWCCRRVEYRP